MGVCVCERSRKLTQTGYQERYDEIGLAWYETPLQLVS